MIIAWAAAFVAMAVANIFVSVAVARDEDLSAAQRFAQLLIVWLLPIVGAVLVSTIRRAQSADRIRVSRSVPIGSNDVNAALSMSCAQDVDARETSQHS